MRVPTTAAAIVAGGRARRFGGQDKSRLVVEGRTIIVRQVDILQRVASKIFVVAGDASRYHDQPVEVVADRIEGLGAIGGIDAALHAAASDHDRVVVIACDLPGLTADLLARLVALADAPARDGAWVRTARGVEPLVACYRTSARDRVACYVDQGGRRASGLDEVLDMATLSSPDLDRFGPPDHLLANINTPDDYARVQYRTA